MLLETGREWIIIASNEDYKLKLRLNWMYYFDPKIINIYYILLFLAGIIW